MEGGNTISSMKVGDIVRLKSGHSLEEFIKGNCIIDDIINSINPSAECMPRHRYHIKTLDGKDCMTWVHIWEIEMVSDVRQQKLEKLGI